MKSRNFEKVEKVTILIVTKQCLLKVSVVKIKENGVFPDGTLLYFHNSFFFADTFVNDRVNIFLLLPSPLHHPIYYPIK